MTIKLKILLFALVAVLLPFGVLGYYTYAHSVRINELRFGQELRSLGALVAKETGRRVRRLSADVGVFAAPPLLREAINGENSSLLQADVYFDSLLTRFSDFRRFRLADVEGFHFSRQQPDRSQRITAGAGVAVVLQPGTKPFLRVTAGVTDAADVLSGYLVANIGLQVLQPLLDNTEGKRLHLTLNGRRILGVSGSLQAPAPISTDGEDRAASFAGVTLYPDHRGVTVLGMFTPTAIDGLSVLAEMDAEEAFAELGQLKTQVFWIFTLVLLVMLSAVYVFGTSLVRPLNGLINGARRVAEGDLDVDLPTDRRDEIGYLSQVFNDMVLRLQESRRVVTAAQSQLLEHNQRLEELTVTDTLTGLANRRSLSAKMALHLERYLRNGRPFSVLMLDLDHFKMVNDRYGHLVGDEVLRQFAVCLTRSIRAVDFVARYGGEEFTIILFETGHADSWELAERIRTRVRKMRLAAQSGTVLGVTVSIGIAEVRDTDIAPEHLLQRADAALYQAKRAGRNCVCFAGNPLEDTGASIGHGQ